MRPFNAGWRQKIHLYTLLTFSLFPFEPRPHRGPVHLHPGPGGSGRDAQEAGGGPERQREKGTHWLVLNSSRNHVSTNTPSVQKVGFWAPPNDRFAWGTFWSLVTFPLTALNSFVWSKKCLFTRAYKGTNWGSWGATHHKLIEPNIFTVFWHRPNPPATETAVSVYTPALIIWFCL